jgi:hypothetical protein
MWSADVSGETVRARYRPVRVPCSCWCASQWEPLVGVKSLLREVGFMIEWHSMPSTLNMRPPSLLKFWFLIARFATDWHRDSLTHGFIDVAWFAVRLRGFAITGVAMTRYWCAMIGLQWLQLRFPILDGWSCLLYKRRFSSWLYGLSKKTRGWIIIKTVRGCWLRLSAWVPVALISANLTEKKFRVGSECATKVGATQVQVTMSYKARRQ